MTRTIIINDRGTLTLPKKLRRRLGITERGEVIANLFSCGGCYSSEPIEKWVDETLRNILSLNRPVLFEDLVLPTRVVATDLTSCTAKVWGSRETPKEPVAFAVRASCSIPFFFQAVPQGNSRFVDGGVLSNLPAFVYALDEKEHKKQLTLKTLLV